MDTAWGRLAGACALVLSSACETSTGNGADAADASDAMLQTPPAHCQIDPVFPPRDGGTGGSCRAARYSLTCGNMMCISDDSTRCDTAPNPSDKSPCVSHCAANEYAAACGPSPDDAGTTEPPASCRVSVIVPGGHPYYCCTCE